MGVGNLNVSTSADINPAVAGINKMRVGLAGLGGQAMKTGTNFGQLESQINRAGNTVAEFEKKFATAKTKMESSAIDLSGMTDRYENMNKAATKHVGIVKQINNSVQQFGKTMKAVGLLTLAPDVAMGGFQAGQTAGKWLFGDRKTDSQLKAEKKAARLRGAQEVRQQRQATDEKFASGSAATRREADVLMFGEERVKRKEDTKDFGAERANKLAAERYRLRLAENKAAEKAANLVKEQEAKEERLNKLKEERNRWEDAERKKKAAAFANEKKDQKTVHDLQNKVADFWKTDRRREESQTLREIEDPRLKQQAQQAFQQLRIADRMKAVSEAKSNNPALGLTEAGTRESYVQRAAIRRQAEGEKHQKEMVNVLREIRDNQEKKTPMESAGL